MPGTVTHRAAVRDFIAAYVCNLVDQGTLYPTGRIVVFADDDTVLSIRNLTKPAFTTPLAGTSYTTAPVENDNAVVTGRVPVRFEVQDCDGQWVWRGTIGPSGAWTDIGLPLGPEPLAYAGISYSAPP